MPTYSKHFLTARSKITGDDAVAAVIVVDRERYLVQHRDDLPQIWFPGHWGCFGGAVETGESHEQALRRELAEELELDGDYACTWFTNFDFDLTGLGQRRIYRTYFEIHVTDAQVQPLRLHEGAGFAAFGPAELFGDSVRLTPYDYFALWMHANRARFAR
jgi:8-oxo-dGTP pyrophosphatase MutT (NUDIX family)